MSGSWIQGSSIEADDVRRAPQTGDARLIGAIILAVVGVLAWLGLCMVVPWTATRPTTIAFFAAILAGMGLPLLAGPRTAIALFLVLALAWRSIEWRVWSLLDGLVGTRTANGFTGSDLVETYAPILVVAASFALAVWRRPPGRSADGHPIQATRAVNWLALPAIVLGPLVGLVAWLWFAPGDVYGRPLMVGLLVGCLGLLVFIGYACVYRLGARPALAAVLALAWSVTALGRFLIA